ncbi:hypothetical protein AAMO2058_001448100 [Amorphochlora amoebiformis]
MYQYLDIQISTINFVGQPQDIGTWHARMAVRNMGITEHLDIWYNPDPFTRHNRHKLDVYVPEDPPGGKSGSLAGETKRDLAPVVIFVHGGGWKRFNRRGFSGIHQNIGRAFAKRGLVTFVPSYRLTTPSVFQLGIDFSGILLVLSTAVMLFVRELLSFYTPIASVVLGYVLAYVYRCIKPGVMHPAHTEDIAQAIAWVSSNCESYGGDPQNITLVGHSAGAHMTTLLLLVPRFLREAGAPPASRFASSVAISGPYNVTRMSRRWFLRTLYLDPVFGTNRETWTSPESFPLQAVLEASPNQISSLNLPPMLFMNAERDFNLQDHSNDLLKALREHVHTRAKTIQGLNHFNSMTGVGTPGHRAERLIDLASEWAFGAREVDGEFVVNNDEFLTNGHEEKDSKKDS